MHLRFRSCIGMPVLSDGGDMVLATLSGVLIHPDTGKIEGFFAHGHGATGATGLFFSSRDIVRFGTRIYVRDEDALAPSDDHIRLATLLDDPRTFLGQKIRTESGTALGYCTDVQFNTESMHVEWIFPRKWFKWGIALPVTDVVEVTAQAIIMRDPIKPAVEEEREEEKPVPSLPEIETPLATSVATDVACRVTHTKTPPRTEVFEMLCNVKCFLRCPARSRRWPGRAG